MGVFHKILPCMLTVVNADIAAYKADRFHQVSNIFEIVMVALSFALFAFYVFHFFRGTCGWELVYVMAILPNIYLSHILDGFSAPFTVYTPEGNPVPLLRYCEWLLCTPVLCMALSNIHGDGSTYSNKSMALILYDIGMVAAGLLASASGSYWLTVMFTVLGFIYGALTFFVMGQIYVEAYFIIPDKCRSLVKAMAFVQLTVWNIYAVPYCFGPEAFGHMSHATSWMSHVSMDFFAKNVWTLLLWRTRYLVATDKGEHGDTKFGAIYSKSTRQRLRAEAPDIIKNSVAEFFHFISTGEHRPAEMPKAFHKKQQQQQQQEPLAIDNLLAGLVLQRSNSDLRMEMDTNYNTELNTLNNSTASLGPFKVLVVDEDSARAAFIATEIAMVSGTIAVTANSMADVRRELDFTAATGGGQMPFTFAFVCHRFAESYPGLWVAVKVEHCMPLVVYGPNFHTLTEESYMQIRDAFRADQLFNEPVTGQVYSRPPLEIMIKTAALFKYAMTQKKDAFDAQMMEGQVS